MNENINLCEILKGHEGETFYSPAFGIGVLKEINGKAFPIKIRVGGADYWFTKEGKLYDREDVECILFPSKYQRDWTKWLEEQPKIPKTWDDIKECDVDFYQVISRLDYDFVNPIIRAADALLKIHQLIEEGYGGNITNEEWKDPNVNKYEIVYGPHLNSGFEIYIDITNMFGYIAFHTAEQAEEFLSYPENVQLVKDFYMI